MRGTLLVNQDGGHNKFYLIFGDSTSITCRWGRIDSHLRYGNFQGEKSYDKPYSSQKYTKEHSKGYEEVFEIEGSDFSWLWSCALDWAKTGATPDGELVATEYLEWFDGGNLDE